MERNEMTESASLAKTPLYALHVELGAKLVPFAGYAMPVQYPAGILKEHQHTRAHAGLFDVSHMGQVRLTGVDAPRELERLVPVDILGLGTNRQRYALFTNEQGGILDDLMVTNAGDHLFVVVNAACKTRDLKHLRDNLSGDSKVEELADYSLLALQGPEAACVMERLAPQVKKLVFMSASRMELAGVECFVTRSGYTGEDGFEISVPNEKAETLARELLAYPEVAPVGLGARDSLRLEAGLCLYGHDIDPNTSPVEAGLRWAVSKARREQGARAGGFPGADIIFTQLREGVTRKRVGIQPEGRAPVRDGAELRNVEGKSVGCVTSGGFGPSVGGPIAMGYVRSCDAAVGTELKAIVRDKPLPVRVCKLPFVTQRYYRGE